MNLFSHFKKFFWYGLYVIAVTGILLALRFPSDDLKSYLESVVSSKSPATSLSIRRLEPDYPLGFRFEELQLDQKLKKGRQTIVAVDNLSVKAEPLSCLKGNYVFQLAADLYGGNMDGVIRINDKTSGAMTAEIALNEVKAGLYDLLPTLTNFILDTTFSGNIQFDGKATSLLDGTGEASFALGKGSLRPVESFFGFTGKISIDEMALDVSLENRKLLVSLSFTGPELLGDLNGTIKLNNRVADSALTLEGSLEALDQLFSEDSEFSGGGAADLLKKRLQGGAVSFMLNGTIEKPKIRFY